MKNDLIELSKFSWKALFKLRTIIFVLLLVAVSYWFFAIRPYLHVVGARLSAPFLEIRTDQPGRLTFAPHREGDWIKEGDILFSISSLEEKQHQKQLQANADSFQKMLAYYLVGVEKATEKYIAARRDVDLGEGSSDCAERALSALQEEQRLANECKQQLSSAQSNLESANQLALKKSTAAPFSGVIVNRQKQEGDVISFGDMVYSLCDPRQVWVDAVIEEKHIAKISLGQKAFVRLPLDRQRRWEGSIAWISPMALPSNGGVPVRISLIKKDGDLLLPNLSADVKIKTK